MNDTAAPTSTPVALVCPVHHEPLQRRDDQLVGATHGLTYPIVDGIAVMLTDETRRASIASGDWASTSQAPERAAFDFYNAPDQPENWGRRELNTTRDDVTRWLVQRRCAGPTLEIGAGKGALQGVGDDDYVAVDVSFAALRQCIDPQHTRVCASADALPFADNTFAFIYTIATLEHVAEAGCAFGEIDRVLKPGGVAYLLPAWHCVQYNCDGVAVRPFGELTLSQKLTKLTLPARRRPIAKALGALPGRVCRRLMWRLGRRRPTRMRFKRLRPTYNTRWGADSDAAARLDSHEACLFFHSRRYDVLAPGPTTTKQLLARHVPVVVRKPEPSHGPTPLP